MDFKNKISRKLFFKWASLALLIPFYKIWKNTVSRNQSFSSNQQTLQIAADLPDDVYFHDRVILIKEHKQIKLFSSKCTHLGCKINKTENGDLVCPCHGSRYNRNGKPIKGPSIKSLSEIDFQVENTDGWTALHFTL